jgi:hypothetical protein
VIVARGLPNGALSREAETVNIEVLSALYARGDYDAVVARAKELTAKTANERVVRLAGLALMRLGRYAEGIEAIEEAAALQPAKSTVRSWLPREMVEAVLSTAPGFAWARYQLAVIAFEERDFDRTVDLATALAEDNGVRPPIRSAASELLCEVARCRLHREHAIKEIEQLLDRSTSHIARPAAQLFRGLVAFETGALDDAVDAFAAVAADTSAELTSRVTAARGVASFRARISNLPAARDRYFRQRSGLSLEMPAQPKQDDRVVILTAADGRSFSRFAPRFVASACDRRGDASIHMHIINPTTESRTVLDEMRRQFPWARIGTSSEVIDHPAPRPYDATARFLAAPEVLAAYQLPVITVDIDTTIIKAALAVLDDLAGCDVGLMIRPRSRLAYPWTRISATAAYFSPFASSFKFLFDVGTYFWDVYDPSGKIDGWRIDQNALHHALSCAASASVRVQDLSSTALGGLIDVNRPAQAKAEPPRGLATKRPSGDVQGARSFS